GTASGGGTGGGPGGPRGRKGGGMVRCAARGPAPRNGVGVETARRAVSTAPMGRHGIGGTGAMAPGVWGRIGPWDGAPPVVRPRVTGSA
ncbi:MAG: hypothetical protein SNJ69_15040, partial [Chloroflexaceae bacterium]